MEYSESFVDGGIVYEHKCQRCGGDKHFVNGAIKYAFFYLESLPFCPVGRRVQLTCADCGHVAKTKDIASDLYAKLLASSFTIYQFILRCAGAFLLLYLLFSWWQKHVQAQENTAQLVATPAINDFLLFDARKLPIALRPEQKYQVAKIVDITGDTISLTFGNFYYRFQSSFRDAIASGQVRSFGYFEKNHRLYSYDQMQQLLANEAIVTAARPEGNMLFGNYVINDTGYHVGSTYYPGERQYASGLAFEQAHYLKGYKQEAFNKFTQAAELDFVLAQIKLAEYYLASDVVEADFQQALYWLEQASLQSNERAIKKYAIVCQQTKGCDVNSFYQRVIDSGVNLTVNIKGEREIKD